MQRGVESNQELVQNESSCTAAALTQIPCKTDGHPRRAVTNIAPRACSAEVRNCDGGVVDDGMMVSHTPRQVKVLAAKRKILIPAAARKEHRPRHEHGGSH